MSRPAIAAMRRPAMALALALVTMLGVGLGACTSPGPRRQANLYQDNTTCGDFGAHQGARDYTDCMLAQQKRRDNGKLDALERQRISTRNSKDSFEMGRKIECGREAKKDREAGRRPRDCH